jgi:Methyltransferase domain
MHQEHKSLFALVSIAALIATVEAFPQERFSFFQASTPESVERMLTLAELRDDDVVVDLGSGDGLIPLTAARMNRRLRGWGVDLDPKLVEQSNERARTDGVADRVRFEHRNAFDADLRDATVVTMWLFPELMRLLRPVILERARPGTRVLTSTWDLGTWRPDKVSSEQPAIYLWVVPARVAGGWDWELTVAGKQIPYGAVIEQQFQEVEGVTRAGDRREVLTASTLRGEDITFTLDITLDGLGLTRHEFNGKVGGDQIVGTARVTPPQQDTISMPWHARRRAQPRYFAPTGTALFQQPPERR